MPVLPYVEEDIMKAHGALTLVSACPQNDSTIYHDTESCIRLKHEPFKLFKVIYDRVTDTSGRVFEYL